MFPVLRYFCLLIPWSFTESEKTSIIPFSVKNAKEEKQLYGYQKAVYPLCIPEYDRHAGYVLVYSRRYLFYIKSSRSRWYYSIESGTSCI